MICNARMYALTPTLTDAWRTLLLRVGERANLSWAYEPHPEPASMRTLWDRQDNGCTFMCGLPFITEGVRPQLLAAPVSILSRYEGSPIYFSEFVVRADAAIHDLSVPLGTRLAHMLPESNSGYNAPRHHMHALLGPRQPSPFIATKQPTNTPMSVIHAVIEGTAEMGVVDSYVLDLLRQYAPALMDQLRSVATTLASPIPVLTASAASSADEAMRARAALLSAHTDMVCRTAMQTLLLERFEAVEEADYRVLAEHQSESDRDGFVLAKTSTQESHR